MAASAISFLVTNLSMLIQKEVGLLWGVEEDMRKLSSTLSTILAVLDDAELKQHQDKSILNWLRKLKDAAYIVGDILDECQTEALKWEIKHQSSGHLKKVWTSSITCYPVVNLTFRHKIGNRMKYIIEDINAIAEERKMFHLNEGLIGKGLNLADDRRETSSSLPPLQLFGREDDKGNIVEVLTEEVCDIEGISVYPIIGMGGLGKTTLAQMIFNDERINSHFELKIWVYVSENFDVKQVMKQIIESTTGGKCKASSLDTLQKEVKAKLSGKRYLLVLDDAWSEDQDEWDKLKPAITCGLPGTCAVVTARSEKVALVVGTLPTHYLLPLSEDDCWLLFRQRAFGPGNEERPELVNIGKEIVKKCSGVPLAAKALGGLMRFRRGENEWINIAESDLWDIPEGECSILPALRLSYYNLSLELRPCFSYCALFLKGSQIDKGKLVHLWMANGFISSKNKIEVEDVGNQIWNELYMRSFFQDEEKDKKGNIYFKMHDLMHDLAQFVTGDECQIVKAQTSSSVPTQRIRHATLIRGSLPGDFPKDLTKHKSALHTVMLQYNDGVYYSDSSVFENAWGSLRALDANGFRMKKFSGSLGNSKHLRYLNLSSSQIRKLPAAICELLNLQTLNLNYCRWLWALPKKMSNLVCLRHLYLLGCISIKDMPVELGKLKELKTLSLFVVGDKKGQRLGELQHMDLGGELEIRHLGRVKTSREATEANLVGKHHIRVLRLSWEKVKDFRLPYDEVVAEQQQQVIEALEPHSNVEEITIQHYNGKEFPVWLSNPSVLKNVVSIHVDGNINCSQLPPLWQLPCLKRLVLEGMVKLKYLMIQNGNNLATGGGGGDNDATSGVWGFPSLEMLEIRFVCELKGLVSMDNDKEDKEGIKQQQKLLLPHLKRLDLRCCIQLTLPLPTLPALESLEIHFNIKMNILNWISKITSLTSLVLHGNLDLVSLPDDMFQNLTCLQTLTIDSFKKLKTLPGNMSSLQVLRKLEIKYCKKLEFLPDGGIESLTSLLEMHIYKCRKFLFLPDSIQTLTQLQKLILTDCSPQLKMLCQKGSGQDWYKIAHVPYLFIA